MGKPQREFIPLAHISAATNGEKCGYGAVVSLSATKRQIICGVVGKEDSKAYAVYAELKAVLDIVNLYIDNGIISARIKLDREKAMLAMAEKETKDGCSGIVKEIAKVIGGRDYTFALEEENKESLSYTMAKRAVGLFSYKNGYKWNPACEEYTSPLFQFCIKEFYTRKTHEQNEYLNFAKLLEQYTGPKHNVSLPISARGEISLWSSKPENQDIAAMFYKCGLDVKTACKCANIKIKYDSNDLDDELYRQIKILVLEKNRDSRDVSISNEELDIVINRVEIGYYAGNYPLRTLKEAVLDAYLEAISERNSTKTAGLQGGKAQSKKVIVASKGKVLSEPVKKCAVCGNELKAPYICEDKDIVNILFRRGYTNSFCSAECFAKAALLQAKIS